MEILRIRTSEYEEKYTGMIIIHFVLVSGSSGNAGAANSRLLRVQVGEDYSLGARAHKSVEPNAANQAA
jgi:hypothetical protein